MLGKALCIIGIHQWSLKTLHFRNPKVGQYYYAPNEQYIYRKVRYCKCCKKIQRHSHWPDSYDESGNNMLKNFHWINKKDDNLDWEDYEYYFK